MRRFSLSHGLRLAAGLLVAGLLVPCRPHDRAADTPGSIDDDIHQLATPGGKVEKWPGMRGGLVFVFSPPMDRLAARVRAAQPRLLAALDDPRTRDEAALVLGRVSDADALPRLIDLLPKAAELSEEEGHTTACVLNALRELTGMDLGNRDWFAPAYSPQVRSDWGNWYAANKNYLYTPPGPAGQFRTGRGWDPFDLEACPRLNRVMLDLEAKITGTPTAAYRRARPLISYEEIRIWRDGPVYEVRLRDFCFQVLLNPTDTAHGYLPRGAIRALGIISDPRALEALHAMCGLAGDLDDASELVTVLGERGDPSSLPVIEKIPPAKPRSGHEPDERRRKYAAERIRLLQKYPGEVTGKPFGPEQQTDYLLCLDGDLGVQSLAANLRNREYDCFLPMYTREAGYVDWPAVRSCLKEIAADPARDDRAKALAHGALARLGEPGSIEYLRRALAHDRPGVRLAAAEGLWRLGHRDGVPTLVALLDLRPLETGSEGVRTGGDGFTVTAIRGGNVDVVRAACEIVGEAGDRSAVEPLRRLLALNLNGVHASGGSGTGWPGRPDVVALARLGDYSGVEVLRASIARGDPLEVVGRWGGCGDFVAIGLKRFIPELLPLLNHRDEEKRVGAAQDILLLLERGR
jgi:HEAT repeat protein